MSMDSDSDWEELAMDVVFAKSRRRERRERDAAAKAAVHVAPVRTRKKRKAEEHPRQPLNPDAPRGSKERWLWDHEHSPFWKYVNRRGVRVVGTRAYNKFRRKFRLPLTEVEKLVAEAQSVPAWTDKAAGCGNGRGHARIPLMLKVLAALRVLGKGLDYESVESEAHISLRAVSNSSFRLSSLGWLMSYTSAW
jgi:hypothetical protein